MKAWRIVRFGLDGLLQADLPTPSPGPGEVLVRVHAVSLNYRDLLTVKGLYNPRIPLPLIPCSDGAGEVVETGAGVTRWKPGDRVTTIFHQRWIEGPMAAAKMKSALGGDLPGVLAEYAVLDEQGLAATPEHLSDEEAATLPCAAVTAWNALAAGAIRPGQTVLIQGTGGVSLFALQLARLSGARVLGTSSSDEKLARARDLGLDAGVNYRSYPDWSRWALDQTGGEGVDLVVEVGGAGTLQHSLRAARIGGTVAVIGVLSGGEQTLSIPAILHRQIRLQGIYVGSRSDQEAMNRAISQAGLHPVVDRALAFVDFSKALETMEIDAHFGKVAIKVTGERNRKGAGL